MGIKINECLLCEKVVFTAFAINEGEWIIIIIGLGSVISYKNRFYLKLVRSDCFYLFSKKDP